VATRFRVSGIILLGLLVTWALWRWAGLLLAVFLLTVVYFVSLRIHPRIRHNGPLGIGWHTCHGTGEKHSRIFPWIYHKDERCAGTGRVVRWGARRWGSDSVQAEVIRQRQSRRTMKQNHTWR